MFVQKSAFAVTGFIKRFVRNLLDLNWNDHLLAEIGTAQKSRQHGANNNEM